MTEEIRTKNDDRELWCAGLPFASRRPLLPEEREQLFRSLKRSRRIGGIALLFVPIVLVLWLLSLDKFMGQLFAPKTPPAAQYLFGLGLAPLVLLTYVGCRNLSNTRGLNGDLEQSSILHFEGILHYDDLDGAQKMLLTPPRKTLPPLKRDPERAQSLEILPSSSRIWTVNGQSAFRSTLRARPNRVAQTPEIAAIAEQWLEPLPTTGRSGEVLAGQRELSLAERRELFTTARRMRRTYTLASCAILLWAAMMGSDIPAARANPQSADFWWVCVPACFALVLLGMTYFSTRKMMQDVGIGRVIIVRRPMRKHKNGFKPDPDGELMTFEVLPVCRRLWTLDGKPAPWRISMSARAKA
jgi:hypothetical protein